MELCLRVYAMCRYLPDVIVVVIDAIVVATSVGNNKLHDQTTAQFDDAPQNPINGFETKH